MLSLNTPIKQTAIWLCIIFLVGCQTSSDITQNGKIESRGTQIYWRGQMIVQTGIELALSEATIEALHSGVPLTFTVDLRLGKRYGFWAREIDTYSYHWTIRYLPLSEHYALEDPTTGQTIDYPRLRTLLTGIRLPAIYATDVNPVDIDSDNYQLQVRCRLNRLRLPPPLRLPAMFASDWRLSDKWRTILVPLPAS